MSTYGYARVSTAGQADDGNSLETQQKKLEGYAASLGREVDRLFIEKGVSAGKPLSARPEGKKLLKLLQPGDAVIATKMDRLFRSTVDALTVARDLKAKGVSLHLIDMGGDVSGNGISAVFFTMAAAFAQFERDRMSERMVENKATLRAAGRRTGGRPPWGSRVVKRGGKSYIEPDKNLCEAVKLAEALFAGGSSLRVVQARLQTDLGVHVSVMALSGFKKNLG